MLTLSAKNSSLRQLIRAKALFVLCLNILAISTASANNLANTTELQLHTPVANLETRAKYARQDACTLTSGETVKRKMAGGETHVCRLRLGQEQFARVIVEQLGIDVSVRIKTPDGQLFAEVDSPNGLYGPESVSIRAQLAGDYIVEVLSDKSMPEGDYELRVEGPRAPTSDDLKRVEAERLFAEAQKLRFRGTAESRKQAIEKYKESLALWDALGDAHGRAYTVCNIGRTYRALGNISEAIASLNQSLSILREAQDVQGQAWVLNEVGATYRTLDDPHRALEYYTRALDLRRSVGDQWGQAQILNNIGLIYSNTGYQQQAIEHYQQAVPLWHAARARYYEANTLNNLGLAYTELGELSFALDNLQKALKFSREAGNESLEAYVLNNTGRIYDTWAESQRALAQYDAALDLFRKLKNPEGEALVLDNIGMVHAGLGDAQRALEYFNRALLIGQNQERPDPRGLGMTLTNVGYAYTIQGNHREALKYFDLALPYSRKAGNQSFIAYALLSKGIAHASLGETQEALEFYKQALDIQNEINDRRGQAITLDKIGQVKAAVSEPLQALDSYEQALQRWVAIGDKQGQALTLYNVGRVERSRNNLISARDRVEEAISIVELLRSNMTGHQFRVTYFAGKQDFYALAIDIRMRLYNLTHSQADMETALATSERARARNLLDLLSEARADLNKGMSAQDAEKVRRLEQEINTLTQSLLRLRSLKRAEDSLAVERRLGTLITEYDDLQGRIRSANRAYAELRRPQPVGTRGIQEQLDGDTLLLEYALGEERSYLWAVTRTGISSYALPDRAEIESATERLRKTITAHEPPLQGETNFQYLARLKKADLEYYRQSLDLSRMILGPVHSQLEGKRLVIVADGALQYIPFEALPRPLASVRIQADQEISGLAPLLTEHEVVYLPSASALVLLRTAPPSRATKTVAVLADPVFDSNDERIPAPARASNTVGGPRSGVLGRSLRDLGNIGASDADFKLERLRFSSAEADYITEAAVPGLWEKAIGFKASRATVLAMDLAQFKIVHFATHAIFNSKNPELSGIVLSMVNERGQPEDGFLGLRDIYNLNLPVDLVVLSACRTGIGKQVRGEGLIGLTRGFMNAGAPRVIASLWKVDDEATAELMKRFYRNLLKNKLTAAASLRQARIEIMSAREQWRAPFYWAGFVLQGDWK